MRKGTNGAVTKIGLVVAAIAGGVIGVTFVVVGLMLPPICECSLVRKQLLVIPIAILAGLCGSIIDSLLGATLQFSGVCSVRRKVNLHTPPQPIGIMFEFLYCSGNSLNKSPCKIQ